MPKIEILVARNNYDPLWQLPVPVALLISWRIHPENVDGGVPPKIASIIAQALCQEVTVSYLSFDARKEGRKPPFLATREPAEAAELFDQGYFVWTMQGQVVLLSDSNQPVPQYPKKFLKLGFSEMIGAAAAAGFNGIFLPGVDGDVAGLWCLTPELEQRILDSLERACGAAGAKLELVLMKELGDRISRSLEP